MLVVRTDLRVEELGDRDQTGCMAKNNGVVPCLSYKCFRRWKRAKSHNKVP